MTRIALYYLGEVYESILQQLCLGIHDLTFSSADFEEV